MLHHNQPQRVAGHIHTVTQGVRAQQRCARIVPENVHQRSRVDGIDMLREQRKTGAGQAVGDAAMDGPQPANRGEQAQRAAA